MCVPVVFLELLKVRPSPQKLFGYYWSRTVYRLNVIFVFTGCSNMIVFGLFSPGMLLLHLLFVLNKTVVSLILL